VRVRVVIKGLLLVLWPADFSPRRLCPCGSYFPVFFSFFSGRAEGSDAVSVWLIFLSRFFLSLFSFFFAGREGAEGRDATWPW